MISIEQGFLTLYYLFEATELRLKPAMWLRRYMSGLGLRASAERRLVWRSADYNQVLDIDFRDEVMLVRVVLYASPEPTSNPWLILWQTVAGQHRLLGTMGDELGLLGVTWVYGGLDPTADSTAPWRAQIPTAERPQSGATMYLLSGQLWHVGQQETPYAEQQYGIVLDSAEALQELKVQLLYRHQFWYAEAIHFRLRHHWKQGKEENTADHILNQLDQYLELIRPLLLCRRPYDFIDGLESRWQRRSDLCRSQDDHKRFVLLQHIQTQQQWLARQCGVIKGRIGLILSGLAWLLVVQIIVGKHGKTAS